MEKIILKNDKAKVTIGKQIVRGRICVFSQNQEKLGIKALALFLREFGEIAVGFHLASDHCFVLSFQAH